MDNTAAAFLGLVGVVVGSAITAVVAMLLDWRQNRRLENDEIRRRRVEIVLSLLGSRYVLAVDYPASSEEVMVFNTAMSLIPVYFSDDRAVVSKLDAFQTNRSDATLLDFLQAAAKSSRIDVNLSELQRVYSVKPGVKAPSTNSRGGLKPAVRRDIAPPREG